MPLTQTADVSALYERDETAWLETMAELLASNRFDEIDYPHLSEYLSDMARRDRREVYSRLVVLLCHLLKWEYQPEQRAGSWRGTIREQRRELRQLLESGTLNNHASDVFAEAYAEARKQAADECEVDINTFPAECAWELDAIVNNELEK